MGTTIFKLPHLKSPGSPAPSDVYYVVETKPGIVGERQHVVSSLLYETSRQADAELQRLVTTNPGSAYTVWKSSTYIEPARWAHDVVLADGTVLGKNSSMLPDSVEQRRAPDRH